jgi:hypothetical protein
MKNAWYKHIAAIVLLAAQHACQKPIECPVPSIAYFSFDIDPAANPNYSALTTSISAVSIHGKGYKEHGIIVYRHNYEREMFAYDATCADNAECLEHGIVRPQDDNRSIGRCQRCSAQYTLVDGIHTKKRVRLRTYSIALADNSSAIWRISNR